MSHATKGPPFKYGNRWQYHPRSDRHSKVACWAIMLDLLRHCQRLREQVAAGDAAIGINHEMRDFKLNRPKNLDLVVCRGAAKSRNQSFADLVGAYEIKLNEEEEAELLSLPNIELAAPSSVMLALEAKACMTEFGKARPRLYDELNSSHQTIHGDTSHAIAGAFVEINVAESFVSPTRNHWTLGTLPTEINHHKQPQSAGSVLEKVRELPRRSSINEAGFDAIGALMLHCRNDGSPVTIETEAPAPAEKDQLHTKAFIERLAHLYATRFSG